MIGLSNMVSGFYKGRDDETQRIREKSNDEWQAEQRDRQRSEWGYTDARRAVKDPYDDKVMATDSMRLDGLQKLYGFEQEVDPTTGLSRQVTAAKDAYDTGLVQNKATRVESGYKADNYVRLADKAERQADETHDLSMTERRDRIRHGRNAEARAAQAHRIRISPYANGEGEKAKAEALEAAYGQAIATGSIEPLNKLVPQAVIRKDADGGYFVDVDGPAGPQPGMAVEDDAALAVVLAGAYYPKGGLVIGRDINKLRGQEPELDDKDLEAAYRYADENGAGDTALWLEKYNEAVDRRRQTKKGTPGAFPYGAPSASTPDAEDVQALLKNSGARGQAIFDRVYGQGAARKVLEAAKGGYKAPGIGITNAQRPWRFGDSY